MSPKLWTTRDVPRVATINIARDRRLDRETGSLTPGTAPPPSRESRASSHDAGRVDRML
jgi:hypothetical protein